MTIQLQAFAAQVLFGKTLEEKLSFPRDEIVDTAPGKPIKTPRELSRPPELVLRDSATPSNSHPKASKLVDERERGRLLHFFGNHELLATELMALALLKFPDAPASFRQGILETLKEEQIHTKLYMHRMKQCGIEFGELPLSDYFWRSVSSMEDPLDYVTRLSLTFEQANLDYSREYKTIFEQVGDDTTANILDKIYRDEIDHVGFGLKWFRKWKTNGKTDWESFRERLVFPLSPARAKGNAFNRKGRLEVGLDEAFIQELQLFNQSKGRTPNLLWFNPGAEQSAARNEAVRTDAALRVLQGDLDLLPAYLAKGGDILFCARTPSPEFQQRLQSLGFTLPEWAEYNAEDELPSAPAVERKIGSIAPWAWTPDSIAFFKHTARNLTRRMDPNTLWNSKRRELYSKQWSASFARTLAEESEAPNWLAPSETYGEAASSLKEIATLRRRFQERGYPDIVLKTPFGTAANGLRLLEKSDSLSSSLEAWIQAIFETQGSLIVEPWLNRVFDFSVQLNATSSGLKPIAYTQLLNNQRGQFRGIHLHRFDRGIAPEIARFLMTPVNRQPRLYHTFDNRVLPQLSEALSMRSYQGPLGIDSFVYRDPFGELKLKPIAEINPRYTMGRIGLEIAKRIAPQAVGRFEIQSARTIKKTTGASLQAYCQQLERDCPTALTDEDNPRISSGSFPLTDPKHAERFVALLHVRSRLQDLPV